MKGLFTYCICLITYFAVGQQGPQYSLQMLNRYQFNPAYAGMDASLSINGAYRAQWEGLPGNPIQQNLNAHMPFYLLNGAFGIEFANESIGAEKNVKAAISYNYVLETDIGLFSAGVRVGAFQKTLDGTLLRTFDGDYEGQIDHRDPNLPNSIVRGLAPQLDFGVYFAGDYFELGFASNQWTIGDINLDGTVRFKPRKEYNAFFEYYIESLDRVDIYPTIYVKTDLKETQIELAVRALYDNYLTGGIGFRGYNQNSIDAIILFTGLRLSEKLSIAYAYDWSVSPIKDVSTGTHELVLKYNLNKIIGAGLPPRVIYNPRFYE
jgi:type IX secretion system PorP/SprF family membrane protein